VLLGAYWEAPGARTIGFLMRFRNKLCGGVLASLVLVIGLSVSPAQALSSGTHTDHMSCATGSQTIATDVNFTATYLGGGDWDLNVHYVKWNTSPYSDNYDRLSLQAETSPGVYVTWWSQGGTVASHFDVLYKGTQYLSSTHITVTNASDTPAWHQSSWYGGNETYCSDYDAMS
jgi:hypothetical protein